MRSSGGRSGGGKGKGRRVGVKGSINRRLGQSQGLVWVKIKGLEFQGEH